MSERQVAMFVRPSPSDPWEYVGFFPDTDTATIQFNLLEMEHPLVEGIFIEPERVFNSFSVSDEELEGS